ncbi:MAG: hypothetical protein KKB13_28005, partial [Chloroflexi bacterium]|nr:hypothetical protein [Chloroflexota bacterium]
PMNAQHVVNLLDEQIQAFLAAQQRQHILTLVDSSRYPHRLLDLLTVDQWWAVADARRSDTLANALLLREHRPGTHVLINWAGRLNLSTLGMPHDAALPGVRRADRLGGQLGARMLRYIYPGWRA